MSTIVKPHRTYETLNAVRGTAALSVAIFHTHDSFWPQAASSGTLAVDIFFMLSGFVLAGAYGDRLASENLTAGRFFWKRLTRFYPLYFAGLALGIIASVGQILIHSPNAIPASELPFALIYALLFLPYLNTQSNTFAPLNGPAWSLAYELWINVIWSAIARRAGSITYAAIVIIAGGIYLIGSIALQESNFGPYLSSIPLAIARTAFSFFAGILLFRHQHKASNFSSKWALAAPAVTLMLLFANPNENLRVWYDMAVVIAISPALIFLSSRVEPNARLGKVFAFAGAISFPMYAIHQPLIGLSIFAARKTELPSGVAGLCFLVLLILASWAALKFDSRIQSRLARTAAPSASID